METYLDETRLRTPLSGEVIHLLANPGEVINAGYPVVTILDLDDIWITFNIREDRLAGMEMGREFTVSVPALGHRRVLVEISYIAPLGDYATWRSTSASGGFDLKTFEIRARPLEPIQGLRPGMSALVSLEDLPDARQ